jgi:hypothetical protein
MELATALKSAQDFRSQLALWGVSPEFLAAVGGAALILFLLSLREVLGWYLRTHHLREDVRALRAQIMALQGDLREVRDMVADLEPEAAAPGKSEPASATPAATQFRLDH